MFHLSELFKGVLLERLTDCAKELRNLLHEERLAGASLLVLANKKDLPNAAKVAEIAEVFFSVV